MVVTRATEQAHELAHSLEALGAEVVLLPTVSFAAVENSQALDAALRRLAEFDWILFSSQNAVRFFCQADSRNRIASGCAAEAATDGGGSRPGDGGRSY